MAILVAIATLMSVGMSAQANAQAMLPEISVQPPKPLSNDHKGGGEGKGSPAAKGTTDRSFQRLNEQLKRKVDETNPVGNDPPLDARSPDTKTGVVNIPGVQQQYGKNFGNSVVPYRPAAPVYTSPLRSGR
ncbi:hypothetical protein [Bradyrhizobium genosp. P]|uniref:hypothetical protein n=1 Tax=Bradyrhizobium genosp. P TaxID=83641 RepID=UPI003CF86A34